MLINITASAHSSVVWREPYLKTKGGNSYLILLCTSYAAPNTVNYGFYNFSMFLLYEGERIKFYFSTNSTVKQFFQQLKEFGQAGLTGVALRIMEAHADQGQ